MKNYFIFCVACCLQLNSFAQVGINTTKPSSASVLDINSSSDNINFGGLLPPVISSLAERNSINPGISDIGLLIFLNDAGNNNFCFQIWNGATWENIYCIISPSIFDIASQDFDTNITWTYATSPGFYNIDNDVWDSVNSLANILGLSGNFLACRDLNNSNGGGNFLHEIIFNNVAVNGYSNVQVLFDYEVFEFDGGDDVFYELFLNDVGQGTVQLIDGINGGGISESETIVLNVPEGTLTVRLTLGIIQNGDDDMGGFDNFRIIGL